MEKMRKLKKVVLSIIIIAIANFALIRNMAFADMMAISPTESILESFLVIGLIIGALVGFCIVVAAIVLVIIYFVNKKDKENKVEGVTSENAKENK